MRQHNRVQQGRREFSGDVLCLRRTVPLSRGFWCERVPSTDRCEPSGNNSKRLRRDPFVFLSRPWPSVPESLWSCGGVFLFFVAALRDLFAARLSAASVVRNQCRSAQRLEQRLIRNAFGRGMRQQVRDASRSAFVDQQLARVAVGIVVAAAVGAADGRLACTLAIVGQVVGNVCPALSHNSAVAIERKLPDDKPQFTTARFTRLTQMLTRFRCWSGYRKGRQNKRNCLRC